MSKIAKNIAHLRKLRKMTQEQFADELNIKKSRLGAYEETRSAPPIEMLIKLADYFNLPIDVLVRRDLTKAESESFIEVGPQRILFPITLDEDGRDMIEVVGMKASAGYLNGYGDPEYIEELQKMKLPFMPDGKFRAFPIMGDSMPPLNEGSYVVGRFIESLDQVKDGRTYVVVSKEEGIVYKRVFNNPGTLILHSDNPAYEPYHIQKADVIEIWEFVCSIRTQEHEPVEAPTDTILSALRDLKNEVASLRVA